MNIVIYAGKYGATACYANWIAEKTGADLYPLQQVTPKMLRSYDRIIFGGAVYGGEIRGIRFLKKNLEMLKQHRLILFTVGLTMPGDEAAFQTMLSRNLTEEEKEGISTYHFLGAIYYKRLSAKEKMMMWVLKSSISKKDVRSPVEADVVEYYNGELDYTDESYVVPLVDEILRDENR